MYALDTNTLIYFFKGEGAVADRILATSPADIAVPAVVVYELETGIAKSTQPDKRRDQLEEFLGLVTLLPFNHGAAKQSARLRAVLEQAGEPIGPMDTLIAGTVLASGTILISRNIREFSRVPGLQVENWYGDA